MTKKISFLTIILISATLFINTCSQRHISTSTGRDFNTVFEDRYNFNFKNPAKVNGMVYVEGGTFTQGLIENNVLKEWNYNPSRQQVMPFYLDETEVTNLMYLEYVTWLEKVFPKSNSLYQLIHEGALPDTLVWKSPLGYFDDLTFTYFRHPAYANYPVVGVNWLQAVQFTEWRTDRINENILIEEGYLNESLTDNLVPERSFTTSAFLKAPRSLFDGTSDSLLGPLANLDVENPVQVLPRIESGLIQPTFRLPTESEWEFAALGKFRNKNIEPVPSRTKFPWLIREKEAPPAHLSANFKMSQGDYGFNRGAINDRAAITSEVRTYPPNDYGLYDMQGNVAEWVLDVFRPLVNNESNDFNYYRGNVYQKEVIGPDGKIQIITNDKVKVDTLPNGRPIVTNLPGEIEYTEFDQSETFMRSNIDQAAPIRYGDGDVESSIFYMYGDQATYSQNDPMYNSPQHIRVTLDYNGDLIREYDSSNYRTTLISDESRVYKGGSWKDRKYWLDPARRRFLPQYLATNFIGFRCAMSKIGETPVRRKLFSR